MKKSAIVKRLIAVALTAALALSLTACQEDPEGSIIAHKSMDKLISQAAASDPDQPDTAQLIADAQDTQEYKATIENESLGVTVKVNAQVDVPEVEKLGIYRVEQRKFDQEFLDKVRAELCADVTLYDGSATKARTKKDVENEIEGFRSFIAEAQAAYQAALDSPEGALEEDFLENAEALVKDYQRSLDELQEEYEAAPAEVNFADYPTDCQIHPIKELYERDPSNTHYDWLYSLSDEDDSYFHGISDGADGENITLCVQNNADYSNKIVYSRDPGYYYWLSVLAETTPLYPIYTMEGLGVSGISYEDYWKEKGVPGIVLSNGTGLERDTVFTPIGSPMVEMSQEDAQKMAEDLLGKLGMDDFKLSEGGLFTEADFDTYRVNYILHYTRQLDGVMLTQSSGAKYQEGYMGSNKDYNKRMWPMEIVEFRIDDSGIRYFSYVAPLNIIETVVDGASIKPFDEVKETFEQMLPVTLGSTEDTHVAEIDKVRLSYSRISEKDSFDTGLVVPVWSFEGTDRVYYEGSISWENSGTLMAINAIDGSIIDSALGY